MRIYTANIEKVGYYAGYKACQYWKVDTADGILDQIEQYGLNCTPNAHILRRFALTMADDDIKLLPLAHSPVLQGVGIERRCPDDEAPLSEMWRKGRTTAYDHSELKKGSEKDVEEEVIEDIVVKHYN